MREFQADERTSAYLAEPSHDKRGATHGYIYLRGAPHFFVCSPKDSLNIRISLLWVNSINACHVWFLLCFRLGSHNSLPRLRGRQG